MKKTMYLAVSMIAIFAGIGLANAQMMQGNRNMMNEQIRQQDTPSQYQYNQENMPYPGMMGGYGMGRPGMMGGYGQGYMYRENGMPRFRSTADYDKFLDETKELRKKMHDLRFQYGEMMRRSDTVSYTHLTLPTRG